MVKTEKLLAAILEECEESMSFRTAEYNGFAEIYIVMNKAIDIQYKVALIAYDKIREQLKTIKQKKG